VDQFACAQAGCPDCLEALLQEHAGLIHHIVQHFGMGGVQYEDLIQEGRIALWRAILHYDPAWGNAFSTYAWAAIRSQVGQARFYADRVEDDPDEEVEAWLELVDELEEDWWRWRIRQALLEVVGRLPARLGCDPPGVWKNSFNPSSLFPPHQCLLLSIMDLLQSPPW
jgi:RNA polymerase sigma factor (sigma-70 family)